MTTLTLSERNALLSLAHHDDELPAKDGDLRIWWVPQVPGKAFIKRVASPEEAAMLLDTLAAYDAFQLVHNIKPDYCNSGGLSVFDGGEWFDWTDEDGNEFEEWRRANSALAA